MQGNLEFDPSEDGESSTVRDPGVVRNIAALLSLDVESCERALCTRVVAARGELVSKEHTKEQARDGRDAFAKVRFKIEVDVCYIKRKGIRMYL